jgi:fucose permease
MAQKSNVSVTRLTVTSWLSFVCYAFTAAPLSVALRHIGRELSIGFRLQGALVPARVTALACSALLCGYAADRIGKRKLLSGAMLVIAVGLLAIANARTYGHLLGGMLVIGAGLGTLEGLVSPLVAELHPQSVTAQLNVLHAFYPAGMAASALTVGFVLDHGVHWKVPFLVGAIPVAAVGMLFMTGRYPEAQGHQRPAPLPVRSILANPMFWLLAAALALTAGAEGCLIYWGPSFLATEYGCSALLGGSALAMYGLAEAVGRLGVGAAVRAVPVNRLLVAMAFLGSAVGVCLVAVSRLEVSVGLLALSGLVCASFWPSILALATERIAVGSATLLAMLAVAGIGGFGGLPWAAGMIADAQKRGLRGGLALVPVSFLLAGIVLVIASRARRGPHGPLAGH